MKLTTVHAAMLQKRAYFEGDFTDDMFGDAEMDTPVDYDLDNQTYDAHEKYWKGLYKGHKRVFDTLLTNPIDETVTFNPDVQGHKMTSLDVLPIPAYNWLTYKDWKKAVLAAMKARDDRATEQLLSIMKIRGNTQNPGR